MANVGEPKHRGKQGREARRGRGRRTRPSFNDPRDQNGEIPSRTIIQPRVSPFKLPARKGGIEASPTQLEEFLRNALSDVTQSDTTREATINYLETEHGLARVQHIAEAKFSVNYSVTTLMFNPHCVLFLQLITQEDVLLSLRLEKAVGTIYNFLYGPNGNRAVLFFKNILDCYEQDISKTSEILLLITEALFQILTRNQGASLQSEFKKILDGLRSCYKPNEITNIQSLRLEENFHKIADVLSVGDTIAMVSMGKEKCVSSRERELDQQIFPVDFPGELSKFGPRHDNDHARISDISILPTPQEVCNDRPDFIPTRDSYGLSSGHHQEGILRLVDSQFRLLREDTSGVVRDAIRLILENWKTFVQNSDWQMKRKLIRSHSPTPLRIYYGAYIRKVNADAIKGLEIELEFDQLHKLRKKNMPPEERRKHWLKSRALNEGGTLLALVDAECEDDMHVVFLQVSRRSINPIRSDKLGHPVCDLVSDRERAMVTLRFPSKPTTADLSSIISMASYQPHTRRSEVILVEFPAVHYNQFEGILKCLQALHQYPQRIPFTSWLVPNRGSHSAPQAATLTDNLIVVPPPRYMQYQTLDLSSLVISGDGTPLAFSLEQDAGHLSSQVYRATSLDPGQADAMIAALSHEIALIQGPPGTGKSYLGIQIARCLLGNKERLGLRPILCVCYTNHALDQFLNELLNSGITRIVRIASRSPSATIESLSLDSYKKRNQIPKIRGQGRKIAASKVCLDNLKNKIENVFMELAKGPLFIASQILSLRYNKIEVQIPKDQNDLNRQWKEWIDGDGPGDIGGNAAERPIEQLFDVNPWSLKREERERVYQDCYNAGIKDRLLQLQDLLQDHASEKQRHTSLFTEGDAQIFHNVEVVGVTTTGLANNAALLRNLQSKVLICEEAGEVLESHLLTALLPSLEHVILIGDHLQLRPRISRSSLSVERETPGPKYNLDESLFERLASIRLEAENENLARQENQVLQFPVAQLDHQRRMHPSIASLIRENLYPELKDHPDTTSYDEVAGMRRRLFWLDHHNSEDPDDPDDPMRSKTNQWEANMVTALATHLCRQGRYKRGEIAILTPYVGQLRLIQKMLEGIVDLVIHENDLENIDHWEDETYESDKKEKSRLGNCVQKGQLSDQVRMATVDNFQGEEATVVIVSLVRSNPSQNCGFLKTPNRINVLLSRAKHGMYIIGDAHTSCRVPMWKSVLEILEKRSNIGPKLELRCPRHEESKVFVSSADDFSRFAPEGGCSNKCGNRLKCGHACTFKCHPKKLHNAVKCMESCTRMKDCGHPCGKQCYEDCGACRELIFDVRLPCGHIANVECQNGGNLDNVRCKQIVTRKMPECGHDVEVQCGEDVNKKRCSRRCLDNLPCGHKCQKECWRCRRAGHIDHGSCTAPCGRQSTTCSHSCPHPCHAGSQCPPCQRPCEVKCKHSKCSFKCCDPCPPCAETCGWTCSHRQDTCSMPCAVPCDIIPCDNRCEKTLECGHRCPSVCGEECPDSALCQSCAKPHVLEKEVDLLELGTYASTNVDHNPIIFLSCGHFYTCSTLDGTLGIKDHYDIDTDGKIIRLKVTPRVVDSTFRGCPECRFPFRNIHRYNRVAKRALLDESTKRFVSISQKKYINLFKAVQSAVEEIEDERHKFTKQWSSNQPTNGALNFSQIKDAIDSYRAKETEFQKRVHKFIKSMASKEQPFGRVNEMLAAAAARGQDLSESSFHVDEAKIQTGFQLRGECLYLKLVWTTLWNHDKVIHNETIHSGIRSQLLNSMIDRLPGLLIKCCQVHDKGSKGKFIAEDVQGMMYHALFSKLYLDNTPASSNSAKSLSRTEIWELLEKCEDVYSRHPGTLSPLKGDIERAKGICLGGTFQSTVTAEEKRQVYEAMATQFSGTGHWYYCRNNHPFTIGECGLPMQRARCPQCGESVGGLDHVPLPGVRRAEDIEEQFGRM